MKFFAQPIFYYILGLILANLVIAAPVSDVDEIAERSFDEQQMIEARSEEWDSVYTRDVLDDIMTRSEDEDVLFTREPEYDALYEREFDDAELERRRFSFKKLFNGAKKVAKVGAQVAGTVLL